MKQSTVARFVVPLCVLASAATSAGCVPRRFADNAETESAKGSTLVPFDEDALAPRDSLDKDFYRASAADLDDENYEKKWQSALELSSLMFFRSFVRAFYEDVKVLKDAGPIIPCFGDPHIENFGFVVFKEGPRYVFNDFDDSGHCPAGIDALRYFTSLRLYEDDGEVANDMIDRYVSIVQGKDDPQILDDSFRFNVDEKRRSRLEKYTRDGKFKAEGEQKRIADELRTNIIATVRREASTTLKHEAFLQGLDVLDVVSTSRDSGGSAGLPRYWLLVHFPHPKVTDIVEMKQLVAPATDAGGWKKNPDPRMPWLKDVFWKDVTALDHHELKLNGDTYLVRSRTKGSIELAKLKDKSDRRKVYKAQVSLLAGHHAPYWKREPGLREWLRKGSKVLEKRYRAVYVKQLDRL